MNERIQVAPAILLLLRVKFHNYHKSLGNVFLCLLWSNEHKTLSACIINSMRLRYLCIEVIIARKNVLCDIVPLFCTLFSFFLRFVCPFIHVAKFSFSIFLLNTTVYFTIKLINKSQSITHSAWKIKNKSPTCENNNRYVTTYLRIVTIKLQLSSATFLRISTK